jgi:hypothetical protein
MKKRLIWALVAYAILATLAGLTLDGKMRYMIWIFLGGLALRTLVAYGKYQSEEAEDPTSESGDSPD